MHDGTGGQAAKRPYCAHLTKQPELRLVGWLAPEAGALRCYVAICGAAVGGWSQWSATAFPHTNRTYDILSNPPHDACQQVQVHVLKGEC
jgi:hypothetical protein